MPAAPSTLPLVTWSQVAAFRLARHHLLERASRQTVVEVAGDMAGVQAQLLSAAQLSLWSRVRDLRISDVQQALGERTLVKASCMRRTLFLAPAHDLAVFIRGATGRAEKELRWTLRKGVPERVVEAAIAAVLDALDQPRTRPEIAGRVSRVLGVSMQSIHGGGWGSRGKVAAVPIGDLTFPVVDLLHLTAARGVVCYGPPRGNEPSFVRADAWLPDWQDLPRAEAEGILLRRYLRAFGPATAADFAMWTGITLTEARAIWAREQSGLAPLSVEGWQASALQEDVDELAQAALTRPLVRLLPYFDTYLLGHRERDHLVGIEHLPRVYRSQGWIAPVVLVDGRAAAVWEQARKGSRLLVKVMPLGALPPHALAGVAAEAQDLARFLGAPEVEVEFG